jgi:hypothetical protein
MLKSEHGRESASELCRLSEGHLLAKFIAKFFGEKGVVLSTRRIPQNYQKSSLGTKKHKMMDGRGSETCVVKHGDGWSLDEDMNWSELN